MSVQINSESKVLFANKKQPIDDLIDDINEKYRGVLSVYGLLKQNEPIIASVGNFQLPAELKTTYEKRKARLEDISNYDNGMNHNEPNLVLDRSFQFSPFLELECLTADYAACQTMRIDGNKEFQLITGNALVWCKEEGKVVFQTRGTENIDWFPGACSLWGGGFLPLNFNDKPRDRSIFDNINREFREETGGITDLQKLKLAPILITKEHTAGANGQRTGSIQFNSLGAEISKKSVGELRPTWEGGVDYCDIKQLAKHFEENEWTPFAVACVLVWLNLTDNGMFERIYSIYKEKSLGDLLGLSGKALDLFIKANRLI